MSKSISYSNNKYVNYVERLIKFSHFGPHSWAFYTNFIFAEIRKDVILT